MPVLKRPPGHTNNNDDHSETLVELRNYNFIPIGSTILVQEEDGGPWTHSTITEKGDQYINDQSYKVCMTKRGWLINQKEQACEGYIKHIRAAPQTPAIQRQKSRHTRRQNEFENQTLKDIAWTYTEARHETPTDDMKGST